MSIKPRILQDSALAALLAVAGASALCVRLWLLPPCRSLAVSFSRRQVATLLPQGPFQHALRRSHGIQDCPSSSRLCFLSLCSLCDLSFLSFFFLSLSLCDSTAR